MALLKQQLQLNIILCLAKSINGLKCMIKMFIIVIRNKERTKSTMSNTKKVPLTDSEKDLKIKELQERNLELKAEVEALKKLRALVLERNAREQKKKQ